MVDEKKAQRDKERILKLHADLCQMLSNPTRLMILENLEENEMSVSELVSKTGKNQSNVSQHLNELRKRNLVESRRSGSNMYYKLSHPKIMEACEIVKDVLFQQLAENNRLAKRGKKDE